MAEKPPMPSTTSLEIRLLMCSLGGATIRAPDIAVSGAACAPDNETSALQNAIQGLVLNVERGAFSDALSSDPVKSWLWQTQSRSWASSANRPHDFYDSVRMHIQSYVNCADDNGDLSKYRALLVMAAGVATLLAFWQANVTGPCAVFPPIQTLFLQDDKLMLNEKDWNTWAIKQLMVDGCDLTGLCALPQYLVFAKLLLVDTLDAPMTLKANLPSSISWWARRALLAHQSILAERSSSLRAALVALKPENWEVAVDSEESCMLSAAEKLEYGLVEYAYGHVDQARSRFEAAREACGLELSLTGALGFRTAHQVDPKAQMVLVTSTQSNLKGQSAKEPEERTQIVDKDDGTGPKRILEEDILMFPKLVASDTDQFKGSKCLNSLRQTVVLAQCLDVKKSNPDDELRGWQMAPFIEAVDSQEYSHFLIRRCCKLLRIHWECTRSRTRQRALLMLEQLVEDIRGAASCDVHERMCYAFCLHFPTLSVLRKELAEMMVSCGLIGEALGIFEELELWNSLIDCYCLLDKKAAALDLIKERLEKQPDDPRLWCALGDVTLNEECYEKAWEVSKHRFGRAQRSLGRAAYNKGEYSRSMEHWKAALTLNSLHADGWFALGSASLKARNLDKAVDSFTRAVQLEPENGEAWNNIAAIHMTRKKSKEAFVAFREALKYKRYSWQMWENYANVALDVGNVGQAIEAVNMVLDLSQGKRIMVDCLTKLMEEVEARFSHGAGSNGCTHSVEMPESSHDALGQCVMVDEVSKQSSAPSKDSAHEIELHEKEWLLIRLGKLLSRAVQTSPSSATWGVLARWHRLKGDLMMASEALLKQVRSLQGSGWQHNRSQFEELCHAAFQLCDVYMEALSKTGNKKELYSMQMLLRNLVKQGETFSGAEVYAAVVARLADVQQLIQNSM